MSLLAAYILLLIVAFAVQTPAALLLYLIVCVLYVLATVREVAHAPRSELALIVGVLASTSLFLVIGIPRIGLSALFQYVVSTTAILAAYAATRDVAAYRAASKVGLIVAQGIILLYLARVGVTGFPLEAMIPGHSSNGITSYLVALQVNHSVASYSVERRLPWVTMLVTLAICVVGFGRGSILASALLLGLSGVAAFGAGRGRSHLVRFVAVIAAVAAVVAFRNEIALFAEANTKIGAGLIDPNRASIISDYLGHLNGFTAIVGGNYGGTVIESDFNGNPHNSFLRAHHTFGLPYLLVIVLLPLLATSRSQLRPSQKAYALFAILVLYFRAATEPILFPTVFDFFLFGMCFVVLRARPEPAGQVVRRASFAGAPEGGIDGQIPAAL